MLQNKNNLKIITNNRYFNNEINEYLKYNNNNNYNKITIIDHDYSYPIKFESDYVNYISQFDPVQKLGHKLDQQTIILNYCKKNKIDHSFLPHSCVYYHHNDNHNDNHNHYMSSLKNKNKINIKIYLMHKRVIIKPENSLGRRGVNVCDNMKQIKNNIEDYENICNEKNRKFSNKWLIQEYIESPALINNKKFHFRIYVLFTYDEQNKKMCTYIYDKGFIYTAKNVCAYRDENAELTGESSSEQVMIYPDDYIDVFGSNYYNNVNNQINKIVKTVSKSLYYSDHVKQFQKHNNCNNYYKLTGWDFLINDNHQIYLAEINTRIISLKYPPKNYKRRLYFSLLDTILNNNSKYWIKNCELMPNTLTLCDILLGLGIISSTLVIYKISTTD